MRTWTIWLLAGISVGLIGWDLWAYFGAGPSATISVVLLEFMQDHPSVPFLAGVVCGHIMFPQRSRR